MRRILSWAFVLLLVLRGLLGSAMAAGFMLPAPVQDAAAQSTLSRAQSPTAHHAAHGTDAGQGLVHSGTALPACHGAASDACPPHDQPPVCPACDICHTALLAPSVLAAPPTHSASPMRPRGTAPFASAQAAPDLKPPIL